MLEGAGVVFEALPADLDETARLEELAARGAPIEERAMALAEAKAWAVAGRIDDPEAVVIGSDQILDLDGAALESPRNRDEAAERLRILAGRRHDLVAGLAVIHRGELAARTAERVAVHMRAYSREEIASYLEQAPEAALHTVGAYELEGIGARLLDRLEGDWFSALGMPLWPLLATLRRIEDGRTGATEESRAS